jgi:hypothetical protein
MKPLVFTLALITCLFGTHVLWASPVGGITGRVMEVRGYTPLEGVNVSVVGTKLGAVTDKSGAFAIGNIPPGTYSVQVRMLGYKDKTLRSVVVAPGASATVEVLLEGKVYDLKGVVVQGRKPAPREMAVPSAHLVTRELLKQVPGAEGDIFRAVSAFPGISNVSDFSSRLSIRGGAPEDNLVLLDNIWVPFPYHFGGLVTAFNSDIVQDVALYAGGFPPRYGNAISSVLDITNRDGNREHRTGKAEASAVMASLQAEGPLGRKASWVVSGRRSYFDVVMKALKVPGFYTYPKFSDLQGHFSWDPAPNHKLVANALSSDEVIKATFDDPDSILGPTVSITWRYRFATAGANWKWMFSPRAYSELNVGRYYDLLRFDLQHWYIHEETTFDSAWEELTFLLGSGHEVKAGANVGRFKAPVDFFMARAPEREGERADTTRVFKSVALMKSRYGIGYLQDAWSFGDKTTLTYGVEGQYLAYNGDWALGPRMSLAYRVNPLTTWRAAWGYYYQFPSGEKLTPGYGNPNLIPEGAEHFILGVDRNLNENWDLRVEGYAKKLWDLTVDDTLKFYTNNGSGRNYGLEFLLEKKPTNHSRFSGWVSYAASKARRRDRSGLPEHNYMYDQPHILTLIANYKFSERTQLGLKWKLASGQPYTPIVGRVFIPYAPGDTTGYWEGVPGGKNSERLPGYHRLDLRLDRKFHFKGLAMAGYLEVFNLYAHKNVGGYNWNRDYSSEEPYYQLPFLPTAGLSWEF